MFVRFFALRVGFLGKIQAETSFPGGFVRAVAFETAVGEQRTNLKIEIDAVGNLLCYDLWDSGRQRNRDGNEKPDGNY